MMQLVRQHSKLMHVVLNHALDAGLGTATKGAIGITEEISSEVVLGFFDTLKLAVERVCLKGIHEFFGGLHRDEQVIDPRGDVFVFVA